jgi:MFS family permease
MARLLPSAAPSLSRPGQDGCGIRGTLWRIGQSDHVCLCPTRILSFRPVPHRLVPVSSRSPYQRLVLRLIGLMVLAHLAFGGIRLTLTLWAVSRGMSPFGVGVLLSMPMLTAVAMGRWSDRVGFRPPVQRGMLMILIGGLLDAWAPHLAVMALGSVLVGWGVTMVQVAVTQAVGQAAGPEGATWGFTGMSMGFSFSGFVGPLAAGLLIDGFGHAMAFLLLCLTPPLGLLLLHRTRSPLLKPVERSLDTASHVAQGSLLALGPIRAALTTAAMVALAWDLFNFFMPVHAAALGLSATAIGAVSATYAAGSLGIRLVLGHLASRLSPERLLTWALSLTVVIFALTPLATGFGQLLVLAAFTGLVLGGGQPLAMTLLHHNAPPGRAGEAIGMRSVIVSGSQTFLPAVFGALGSFLGTGPVFWVVAATILVALGLLRMPAKSM